MRRLSILLLLLAACTPSTARRPAHAPTASRALDCATDESTERIDQDLGAMLGGGTAMADHIGPDATRALLERVRADPERYLDRFECRFLSRPPADGEESLLMPVVLSYLFELDPDRVREIGGRLLDRYAQLEREVPASARDESWSSRLADRRREIETLRAFEYTHMGEGWAPAHVTGVGCTRESPFMIGRLLQIQTCGCGEPVACTAALANGTLQLDVRIDQSRPGECTECAPAQAACWLPELEANHAYPISIGGNAMGTLHTDTYGRPDNRCP